MTSEVNSVLVTAHELKAPLAVLRQLAFSLDYVHSPEEQQQIQTQMIEVTERAIRQVDDLTKIGRLESHLFKTEPVSVRQVCDEVARELDILAQADQLPLRISYRNRNHLVIANHDLLYSIIYNFCLNAIHYSEYGMSATLTLKDYQHQYVRFTVRDFGPALPSKIWRAINQGGLDAPTNIAMRPGSSGLGLYIASKFSEYMNAPIGAVRHRDGTSFYVDLPISKQASFFSC